MTIKEAKEILEKHNNWRRCNEDDCECEMMHPKELGKAIDIAIDKLN